MTRFIHDEFAKDYLEELLKPYGQVNPSSKLASEIREIDVIFTPSVLQDPNLQVLGLLGRFAEFPAIFEPFRNAATQDEICDCVVKVLEVKAELRRRAERNKTFVKETNVPKLWVLTPTVSDNILSSFNVEQKQDWMSGIYFLGEAFRTIIVAIHRLPSIPETLWLRILGRGTVQESAITELQALPATYPFQKATLELVYNLRQHLRLNQNLDNDDDDRGLVMRLEPLYQQDREQAKQEGRQEGERLVIENLLKFRFAELDNELSLIIEPILRLSPEEFTPLLMQLSKEELIARFSQ